MKYDWRLERCGGVDFYTAMILATGLLSQTEEAWLPAIVCWDSRFYGRPGVDISDAFLRCYLRQDWQ